MTKRKAKALTLKVWRYLRDHPELASKHSLPPVLFLEIEHMVGLCPLCERFLTINPYSCKGCPLLLKNERYGCNDFRHGYRKWSIASSNTMRAEAADEIVKLVEAWEVK